MGQDDPLQAESNEHLRLRIGFPGQDRDEVCVAQALIRIGSGADSDICLNCDDVAPHHVSIEYRHRCWMLRVAGGAERVHVNARPVRELALLRPGDVISVGGSKILLLQDSAASGGPGSGLPGEHKGPGAPLAGLRCVAGPLSGRLLLLRPDMQLDRLLLPGMDGCLRVHGVRGGARFEQLGDTAVQAACNGNAARSGFMRNGDQLSWGRHRFVLETSAAVPAEPLPSRTRTADPGAESPQDKSERREVVWLLGVAALLALCIAALLLLRQ